MSEYNITMSIDEAVDQYVEYCIRVLAHNTVADSNLNDYEVIQRKKFSEMFHPRQIAKEDLGHDKD